MRKYITNNVMYSLILGWFSAYSIKLFIDGDLTLYIHPRYIWFTVATNIVGLIFAVAGIGLEIRSAHRNPSQIKTRWSHPSLLTILTVLILLLGLFLPPSSLKSSAADQKQSGFSSIETRSSDQYCIDINEHPPKTLEEWSYVLESCSDFQRYQGEEVELTGFVYVPKNTSLPKDTFLISRFVISCCAVDARPVGVPVTFKNWQEQFPTDSWIIVKGTLEPSKFGEDVQLTVRPTSAEKIKEPDQPYEYYSPMPPQ